MKWIVYILKSLARDVIYIGSTGNLNKRLMGHNKGDTTSTKKYIPWEVIYTEEYDSKKEALARERQLKKWKSRKKIEILIEKNNKRP